MNYDTVLETPSFECVDLKPLAISGYSNGVIKSPNYPGDYPDNANCQWIITVDARSTINITFIDINLEKG